METKKRFVTFKMDFDQGIPHCVKVAESREKAAEEIERMVNEFINTELADYGEVDEEWKEEMLSMVNRVKQGMANIVNDMLNNECYYLVADESEENDTPKRKGYAIVEDYADDSTGTFEQRVLAVSEDHNKIHKRWQELANSAQVQGMAGYVLDRNDALGTFSNYKDGEYPYDHYDITIHETEML